MTSATGSKSSVVRDNIPAVFTERDQWVLWKTVLRDGKPTKVPFQLDGQEAKSNDPTIWASFDAAWARYQRGGYDGIGYVFSHYDPFVGVDFDGCRDPGTGKVAEWARDALKQLDSYSEVSPSGSGVKVFVQGVSPFDTGKKKDLDFPAMGGKNSGIEIYANLRYFCMTGQRLAGVSQNPESRQLHWLREKFWPASKQTQRSLPVPSSSSVVDRARKYVAKLPPAISGSGGHNATFHAACICALDFGLSQDESLDVLREFNERCEPPWSEKELLHKVESADQQPGERNRLRDAQPKNWDNIKVPRYTVDPLADGAEAIQPDRPVARIERFQPFPTDALPEPIRGFVVAGAAAIGCDTSYLALPMVTVLASAIGNSRRIRLKQSWTAPAILWTVIVGESGTSKSPAFRLAMRPILEREQKALARHAEDMQQYDVDLARYDKAMSEWKRDKKAASDPPEKPETPQAERFVVNDTTVEALAPLLLANPRGLLLGRDELAGWLGSFDRYSGGKGADASHWLSMFDGESITVDRKTGSPKTIHVPLASILITGGIQPAILHRALGVEHRQSGLAARFLLASPPRKPKRWSEADVASEVEAEVGRLVDRLFDLQPTVDDDGHQKPVVVGLTPDAKPAWEAYYNSHGREQVDLAGELAAAWSKLEGYAARLALVIHFTRWAADDPTLQSADEVDAASIAAGVRLAQWFKREARRVYSLLGESDDDADQRWLVEWIERKGGSVTAREVQQGHRQYRTAGDAVAALDELASAGCGDWQPTPPGQRGQPTRRFILSTVSTV